MNEILALYLARKEEIKEIVDFYGAKLEGRNACICMEYMAGEKKSKSLRWFPHNIRAIMAKIGKN